MPILIKLLFFTTAVWSFVYTTSYAVNRFKNRHPLAAFTALLLAVALIIAVIVSLFNPS